MPSRPPRAQGDLFGEPVADPKPARDAPLAERMRPATLDEFVGQRHVVGPGHWLREVIEGGRLQSFLLWGPPGSGKTTLARLVAARAGARWVAFSAVLAGVKEVRAVIAERCGKRGESARPLVLFIDEIHRFNKAQQDAFLPHVEDGSIHLIGATTENPSFSIIAPLLSRCSVVVLEPLAQDDVKTIILRALDDPVRGLGARRLRLEPPALRFLVESSQGDARRPLNIIERAADLAGRKSTETLTLALVEDAAQHRALRYDKAGDQHYDVISAFIKSLRGSDPDAALYWMMRMLEAGEDPLFVARRMVIFAAEDVGNADPRALTVAVAVKDAFHFVGLPEGRIPLAQGAVYLATAPKSNASYKAMLAASKDVVRHGALAVPPHLRNAPTEMMAELGYGRDYRYPHDYEDAVVAQQYLPDALKRRRYYFPSRRGDEVGIAERLAKWAALRKKEPGEPGAGE